jgi:predicted nucleotidyltransferase
MPEGPMLDLVKNNRKAIDALCRRFRVRRLELFGSATSGAFDPETSDLDFLVEFLEFPDGGIADAYFGLREGLRGLLQREVDLVTVGAVKNPYLKKSIERSKELLYAA